VHGIKAGVCKDCDIGANEGKKEEGNLHGKSDNPVMGLHR
jgi:hypothetical protein